MCGTNFGNGAKISTHTLTWSVTMEEQDYNMALSISTHTLTWSVTMDSLTALYTRIISTHTLTWSVTRSCRFQFLLIFHFNSHAHVERDTMGSACVAEFFNFNSHAHVERDFKL